VSFATGGRSATAVAAFVHDLKAHEGDVPNAVSEAYSGYVACIHQGSWAVTAKRFHHLRRVPPQEDHYRRRRPDAREERHDYPELSGMRYALLRNEQTMSDAQLEIASAILLRKSIMKTARAFHLKSPSIICTP
jgi:Transposase